MQLHIEKDFSKYREKLEALGFHVDVNRASIDIKTAAEVPFYIRKIKELGDITKIYIEDI